ncbi:MAG TPA: type II secretion system protein M [Legionellaceae bacterium]|nr:type II secretion system protein M [Legionellaceae bacterium]
MKDYWHQLNEREQMAVMIAGICLGLYLLYALVFSPLMTSVERARVEWQEKKETLIWMRAAEKNYTKEKKPQTVTAQNLLSVLTKLLTAASFHHFPYQLAQTATGEIQLTFEQVPYNAFILWLQDQTTHYTLTIKTMDINQTDTPGIVKVMVMFSI